MKIINGEKRGRPGRWLVDFYEQDGKRRIETYATQKAAKDALGKRLEQLRKDTYRSPSEIPTLQSIAEAWLANKADRRPATVAFWENHVHRHILPALGARRVDRIATADVEAFRAELRSAAKMLPLTVNRVLTTLTAILDRAVRDRMIEANPARLAERCRLGAEEQAAGDQGAGIGHLEINPGNVPTPEEAGRLIAAAEPGVFRTYFMAAVMTGARPEELLALPWSNVDLEGRSVSIRVAVSWARTRAEKAAGARGPRFFAPKTKASRRVIPLPPELVMALRWWKRQCPASAQNLVFPKRDGLPMHRKVLYDSGLVPALKRAGLRHFDVYSLRHCFASTLAMQGRPATEVAYYLGHSSAAITQAIYQHWFPKQQTGALDELARAVLGRNLGQKAG